MLRILIVTGALLMLAGFGAAGLQYWQGLPEAEAAAPTALPPDGPSRTWLISPTGAIVPEGVAETYLEQDRFVPDRMVHVTRAARLDALLTEGEKLPETPYLQVMADIRAPTVAAALCPILTGTVAEACAVHSARVVAGSVDPVRGTADFRIELAYRLKMPETPLPDLAAHVLDRETVQPDIAADPAVADSAESLLAATLQAALTACADEERAATCRLLGVRLDWLPRATPLAQAEIGWLRPLPDGMIPVLPLDPLPAPQPQG